MNPVQKISKNDSLLPFSFVYQDTKSPQKELPDHSHEYYEIVYVYRGKGHFFINDTFYEMGQGDVFLIPINTIHRALPDKHDPVTSTAIFFGPTLIYNVFLEDSFSYLHLFDSMKKQNHYKITLQAERYRRMESYLSNIHQELTAKEMGSRHAALLLVHQILLDLYRVHIQEKQGNTRETVRFGPSWIKEILVYIDQHLNQPLSLTVLAQQALVSPEHFSRVFKHSTGMGLTVYLNTKKMIKAKELLLMDHTLSDIAEMCGFESMSHFHRIFKKYIDSTPSNYRKQYKDRSMQRG
jgi:AraC-like DNA-binding protein